MLLPVVMFFILHIVICLFCKNKKIVEIIRESFNSCLKKSFLLLILFDSNCAGSRRSQKKVEQTLPVSLPGCENTLKMSGLKRTCCNKD